MIHLDTQCIYKIASVCLKVSQKAASNRESCSPKICYAQNYSKSLTEANGNSLLLRPSSSIYLFRSNANIFLLESFIVMNNGTCPTMRDKTAMCKVCFPWDRQIITFQLPSIPSADRARIYPEVLVFPRYMYTFFLVYQESSPSFRTSYDISLFDLSLSIAISKIFSMMIWIFFIIFVLLFASFIS